MKTKMPLSPLPPHGGDLAWASEAFGEPEAGWLDLSTGINPCPYPLPEPVVSHWTDLPSPAAEGSLRRAAGACYGLGEGGAVVPAPGTQALIQILPRLMKPGRVAILGPTYSEHAKAWTAEGHKVETVTGLSALADAPVKIVVNPNNPDGRVLSSEALLSLAEKSGLLVVDEAFADMTPEHSLASLAGRPGLVVLRSFGKFFGLAGVRLGFALCGEETARSLKRMLGPWSVSGPALALGSLALADGAWQNRTRERLTRDAKRLDGILRQADMAVLGGTDLFRLVRCERAGKCFEGLAKQGILVRAFATEPDLLRFGLPGREEDWLRLVEALRHGH